MTKKLYLDLPFATRFQSTVLKLFERGEHIYAVLDATLFYPTSGGQNHDTGVLSGSFGEAKVVNVVKDAEDPTLLLHEIRGDQPQVQEPIQGTIDWDRRFRHMQWHTGQHLLSQAFHRLDPAYRTVSVSFASALCTVDFEGAPTPEDLLRAEQLVNKKAYENLPIRAFTVEESALSNYPLRRPPQVRGAIRLIAIGEWELAACGAPHLSHSAQALPIKILKAERIRSGLTRVTYKAGLAALEDYQTTYEVSKALAVGFSAQIHQLPERVERLREQLEGLKAKNKGLANRFADQLLKEARQRALKICHQSFLFFAFDELEEGLLKRVMQQVGREPNQILLAFLDTPEKTAVTLMATEGVEHSMGRILQEVFQTVPGRGGGRQELAQGALPPEYREVFKHKVLELLRRHPPCEKEQT